MHFIVIGVIDRGI